MVLATQNRMIGISSRISYNSLHFSQTSPSASFSFTGPLHCGQAKISNKSLFIITASRVIIFFHGKLKKNYRVSLGGCPRIAIFSQIEANSKKLPEAYT
jgi:hypothetical protein